MELNPILVRELRGRMRGARAFVLLTIYLLIVSGVALLLYATMASTFETDLNAGRQIGRTLFLVISLVALVEVCIITPVLTSGSIAGEKERQTFDLLIASLLSPWQIVWGKLASALIYALLLIVAVVPVLSLAFLFGGVSALEVLVALIGLAATAVLYATIGLFWSSLTRSSLGATSFALGSIIMKLLGIPFLAVMFMLAFARDVSSDITSSVLFVYLSRLFISAHPFIALGITEAHLASGGNPFFEVIDIPGSSLILPSAWIMYLLFAAMTSVILIILSVRMLRPVIPAPAAPPAVAPAAPAAE
ncbi:MAG TPA: ABC transporter permease [Roseiflexaceae bacterium]|nr:ABC transporter permease [Roseiflexaceae bacterium]HMP42493.1 ABC transporter permease [Roseiflexaceae bacterium]